jgi:hypothetical protein
MEALRRRLLQTVPGRQARLTRSGRLSQFFFRWLVRRGIRLSPLAYNITVCHERKFMWFRVAKVGSRTIFHHLRESGVKLDAEHPSFVHYPVNLFRDYYKFGFVRNPWDRLVSCWLNKVVKSNYFKFEENTLDEMRSFPSFVRHVADLDLTNCDRHLMLQSRLLDLNTIDYVGRLESFEDDLRRIFERLGLPIHGEVIKKNPSRTKGDYRSHYDDATAEMAGRIYLKDIQIFKYEF